MGDPKYPSDCWDKTMQREIAVMQTMVPPYRAALFAQLADDLKQQGVRLRVLHGGESYESPAPESAAEGDTAEWDVPIRARSWLGGKVIVQCPAGALGRPDAIILEHAARVLTNVPMILWARMRRIPVAFWGQGRNRGRDAGPVEVVKRATLGIPDWWFTYTEGTRQYLIEQGVSPDRITVLWNAVDTRSFSADVRGVANLARARLSTELGVDPDAPVGLFCGRLTPNKHLGLLVETATLVSASCPGFVLVIAGEGPEYANVQRLAAGNDAVRVVGGLWGERKSTVFARSTVFVHAGSVGLAVLDAFAARLPVVCRGDVHHGPEIEYVVHEKNGLIASVGSAQAMASQVLRLLEGTESCLQYREAAGETAAEHGLEQMANRFCAGIRTWLQLDDTAVSGV